MTLDPKLEALIKNVEEVILDVRTGKILEAVDAAGRILDALVDAIPVDTLKAQLTERDRTFVDLRVDVAESTKVEAAADLAEVEKLAGK